MYAIIGFVIVTISIMGGYLLEKGNLSVLMQPAELVIIFGAAVGTVVIANPPPTLIKIGKGLAGVFSASTFTKALYLESLVELGIDPLLHDIRFVEDDWENPSVGAWGLGWEVWCDGMEVSQFTYFQQVGGLDVRPVSGELTYGLERLAMYVLGYDNVYDMPFNDPQSEFPVSYGDVFLENERQQSRFNFELSDSDMVLRWFDDAEMQAKRLLDAGCPLPAYDYTLKASHLFNLLDARGVVSPTERQSFIARVRELAKGCASAWVENA